jgi:hypothetical protein
MTASAFGMQRTTALPHPVPADITVVHTIAVARTRPHLAATSASILAALLLGFAAYVGAFGAVVHARSQQLAYATLREQLANGTAPLGQVSATGAALELGAPVALLEAPGIHEVVREGTTAGVLTGGPGHRRDTPLPGQRGTSLIYGRAAAFGGPFAAVTALRAGSLITVTTGQGRQEFRVIGIRRSGDALPSPAASRLTLLTADGPSYLPSGVVRVDADLVGDPKPAAPLRPVALSVAEQPLAADHGALVGLVLWTQALVLAACLVVWMAVRWGRRQAWIVGVPALGAIGVTVASFAAQLLPNLT